MDTICAPAYVNIFMANFKLNYIYPYMKDPSIKFEFKYPQTKIEFLDVLVYKDQNNMLQPTIYRKQTDRKHYLDARSEHPMMLKDSIPYSQALRRKRICSSQQE